MKNLIKLYCFLTLIILFSSCKKEIPDPPLVTTSAVNEISYTTATAGGNVTSEGGATVISRGVCWDTSTNPTIDNSKSTVSGTTGEFTSNLTQLTPNTLYYIRAYASNSGGTSYGEQVSFTTNKIEVPVLSTNAVISITQTSAVSGGNITDEKGAIVTERGVCWGTNQNPTLSESKTSNGTGLGSFTSNLTGLSGNTTYYVRAYATNLTGTAYGEQLSFKTLPVLATIGTEAVTELGFFTGKSGGNVSSDGGSTVIQRGICWSTSQNPTTNDDNTIEESGVGTFISSMENLLPGTTYFVRAYATNSVGTAYGDQIEFTTIPKIVSDVDGNSYNIIQIGDQYWFKENVKATKYRNGDPIATTTPLTADISGESEPKYQWPSGGDESNLADFGRLYTWYAVNDSRNICPDNWHIPALDEFKILIAYLGGENLAGDKLKESGTDHWPSPNSGTNESDFTALPAGDKSESMFRAFGDFGFYWSSSYFGVSGGNAAYYMQLDRGLSSALMNSHYRHYGYSVRCVKTK